MSSRDEGIVDVEKRKVEVEYVLGDPTIFPPEYLVWLKRFLEQSGLQLPASAIFGSLTPGGGSGSLRNIAAGVIVPFAGTTPPAGSVFCNGQLELINDYPKLAEILGATWGPKTATTFTIPDLRDRVLVGAGSQIGIAATDGMPLGQRGPRHKHTVNDPMHAHGIDSGGGTTGVAAGPTPATSQEEAGTHLAPTGITVGPTGTVPTDTPAYAGILYVITTG